MPNDRDLYRFIAQYQFLTAEHLSKLAGRDHKTIQKRLQMLYEANILNRQQRDRLAPYVYFFAEKGGHLAAHLGYLAEPRWTQDKSKILIDHDLEISEFHLTLEKAFPGQVQWEQWRGDLKDRVETPEGSISLIPDAKFTWSEKAESVFFLEVVKSAESEYMGGKSNLYNKIALYAQYKPQFRKKYGADDFRVLWVLPTKQRVLNLLAKIEDDFPSRKFFVTYEEKYRTNIAGKIWWTPKDFRDKTYSLQEG